MTLAVFVLAALVAAVALFLLAAKFLPAGEQIAPAIRDEPIWTLPADRLLAPTEVADVRLPVALRGYRFAETDLLLDRLGDELRQRDAEIAALRAGQPYPPVAESTEAADPTEAAELPEPTEPAVLAEPNESSS